VYIGRSTVAVCTAGRHVAPGKFYDSSSTLAGQYIDAVCVCFVAVHSPHRSLTQIHAAHSDTEAADTASSSVD